MVADLEAAVMPRRSKATNLVHGVLERLVYGQPRAVVILAAVAGVIYAVYALTRHRQLFTAGYDLGIFDQAVRAYASFEAPTAWLKGPDFNLLGDHFHPILAVLAPLYWVWDDPRTLLIAQAAILAWSAFPVHAFIARRTSARNALIATAGYLFAWPIQGMVDFDFHEVAFAVPLLAVAIDAIDRRRPRALVIAAVLLLLVREDMGAVVVVIGLIAWSRGLVVVGRALVVAGAAFFVLVVKVIVPSLSPTGAFAYWSYDALGAGPVEVLRTVVTRPWVVARELVSPWSKVGLVAALLAPLAFLPLLSSYVLITVPLLAQRLLSSRENLWTTEFHYSAPLAPILFMAAWDAWGRWRDRLPRRTETVLAVLPLAVALVGMIVASSLFPFGRLIDGDAYRTTARMTSAREALPLIPDGACVEVDDRFAPQLTARHPVLLPSRPGSCATWMVLDMAQEESGWLAPTPERALADGLDRGFKIVGRFGTLVVLTTEPVASQVSSRS